MNSWNFIFQEAACSELGIGVSYSLNGAAARTYGTYQVMCTIPIADRKKYVMDQILAPGVSWDAAPTVYYDSASDQVYVNGRFYSGAAYQKELVTNLTDNELLIQAVVHASSQIGQEIMYVSKYSEGGNSVFIFNFQGGASYNQLGAGAGLTKFISQNSRAIAILLLSAIGLSAIWLWRDVRTKQEETKAEIEKSVSDNIQAIIDNPQLTPQQKEDMVTSVLNAAYPQTDSGFSWNTIFFIGIAVLIFAYSKELGLFKAISARV